MEKRFMCIWFPYLLTDWLTVGKPELKNIPVVLAAPERNRNIVTAANPAAETEGIYTGMAIADAKACSTSLVVAEHIPGKAETLLQQFALWCIRYTPIVTKDLTNGLILDLSGCAHLWGGEQSYLEEIVGKLRKA
ncbi:MAG: DNA polymerase Y family protein, partial [Hymenobacter sp.]